MSKSILVMDTPECCDKCPLFSNVYTDMTCRGNGRTIDYPFPDDKIQNWCPLGDLPEKKPKLEFQGNGCFGINEAMKNSFNTGFNACIDEILKGD